jgi:hypothetical protein
MTSQTVWTGRRDGPKDKAKTRESSRTVTAMITKVESAGVRIGEFFTVLLWSVEEVLGGDLFVVHQD